MKLKQLNTTIIRSWNPCYDPVKHIAEDWTGDVVDLLKQRDIPFRDRLWCALRTTVVSEKLIRLYAIKAASSVEHLMNDERSRNALKVAQAFIDGLATREELTVARKDAAYAAYAAAYAADAAADAAYAAADAAVAAAYAAAYAACFAACSAACKKHQEAQIDLLITMIGKGIETGDSICE